MPRVRCVPPAARTEAEDAAWLASSYGLVPLPWQVDVLRGWLGVTDRRWVATRCGLAVPRQNGKNGVVEVRELYGMVALGERILHTAHEVKTARKAFARLLEFFDNPRSYPELAGMVREIRRTNGQEAIVLTNGGQVEFIARSRGSGRGFTADVLVLDEAQELSEESLSALKPTISTSDNPQTILLGTPPVKVSEGEVFTRYRTLALAGGDGRLCWDEWSCDDDIDSVDIDDRDEWAARNPSLGLLLREPTVADERADMDPLTFARERLGWWKPKPDGEGTPVIDAVMWDGLVDAKSAPLDPVWFGFDMTRDRSRAAVSVCGRRDDGRLHVGTIDHRSGSDWLVDRLEDLKGNHKPAGFVVDARSAAASLLPDLERLGIRPVVTSSQDMARACGTFYDHATQDRLRHTGGTSLSKALAGARKRDLEGSWAWDRKGDTDISPLVAATLAVHGMTTASSSEPFVIVT